MSLIKECYETPDVFFCRRSRLAIIPQDAFLFSGAVRINLDPWKKVQETILVGLIPHFLRSWAKVLYCTLRYMYLENSPKKIRTLIG